MRMVTVWVFVLTFTVLAASQEVPKLNTQKFPDDFMFGTGSSAYQIEGAWNADGKTESNWDRFVHTRPDKITNNSNADISCDSYHKYKEDITLLRNLRVDFYRFSLSWSRILPQAVGPKINKAGVDYYNNVINELLLYNITPVVTIYHWDLPQYLQHLGGFTNPSIVDWYYNYAKICFEEFGDRVKIWTTFNEPRQICLEGYGTGRYAPGLESSGVGDYICSHNLLKAHARVYHLYNDTFREIQKGKIGIAVECEWFEPASETVEDLEAAERKRQFFCGWFVNPIFNPDGDYPTVMKTYIAERSKEEGFSMSRLLEFTAEELIYLKGTSDYFGFNHYSTYIAENKPKDPIGNPSHNKDLQVTIRQDDDWAGTQTFRNVPWGFRKVLKWIKENFQDPEIYVLENGIAEHSLDDQERINYHTAYLSSLLDAIYEDDVKVQLYSIWSFLDLFEWDHGYS